jgi:hypothetical protein
MRGSCPSITRQRSESPEDRVGEIKVPIHVIASASGISRFTISRWLKLQAQPRLPELLAMIDVTSDRVVDFVGTLMDPARWPSLAPAHRELALARELAYRKPWTHAVLRAMELAPTAAHPRSEAREVERIARTLGIDQTEVASALELLEQTGQVKRHGRRRVLHRVINVDTGHDPQRARELKRVCTRDGRARARRRSSPW